MATWRHADTGLGLVLPVFAGRRRAASLPGRMASQRRYLWDFFGRSAEPTAAHFEKHLAERLAADGMAGCVTGLTSAGDGHTAAYCDAPEAAWAHIEAELRPARREEVTGGKEVTGGEQVTGGEEVIVGEEVTGGNK